MSDKIIENNQVTVIGSVASEFTYSHEVFGEGFYMVDILVKRLSNSSDRIPVMVLGTTHRCNARLQRQKHYGVRTIPVI